MKKRKGSKRRKQKQSIGKKREKEAREESRNGALIKRRKGSKRRKQKRS